MAGDFSYLSYSNTYKYARRIPDVEDIDNSEYLVSQTASCFSKFFSDCVGNRHIVIELHSGIDYVRKEHYDNACLITKTQIESHIEEAKKLFDFMYSVSRKKRLSNNYWGYEITIDISVPSLYKKYLMTWIRYLYEYPFNVALLDIFRMKKMKEFKNITAENLILLVLNCHISGDGWERGVHSISKPRYGPLYTTEELKERLKSLENEDENSRYILNRIYPQLLQDLPNLVTNEVRMLDYWLDNSKFIDRTAKYLEVYNKNKSSI